MERNFLQLAHRANIVADIEGYAQQPLKSSDRYCHLGPGCGSAASASSRTGSAIGIMIATALAASGRKGIVLHPPSIYQLLEAAIHLDFGEEAKKPSSLADVARRRGTGSTERSPANSGKPVAPPCCGLAGAASRI
jgi:hypothetical protein